MAASQSNMTHSGCPSSKDGARNAPVVRDWITLRMACLWALSGLGLGGGFDRQQRELGAVVGTGHDVEFAIAQHTADGPRVLEVFPLLELGGVAQLEWASDYADGFTAAALGDVHREVERGGVEGAALVVALGLLEAVQHGFAGHLHFLGFLVWPGLVGERGVASTGARDFFKHLLIDALDFGALELGKTARHLRAVLDELHEGFAVHVEEGERG